jgi:hypothetical protein
MNLMNQKTRENLFKILNENFKLSQINSNEIKKNLDNFEDLIENEKYYGISNQLIIFDNFMRNFSYLKKDLFPEKLFL